MLSELLEEGRSSMSIYLNVCGSTILHAAAGRGQLQMRHMLRCHCLQTSLSRCFCCSLIQTWNLVLLSQSVVCTMEFFEDERDPLFQDFYMLRITNYYRFVILNARISLDLLNLLFVKQNTMKQVKDLLLLSRLSSRIFMIFILYQIDLVDFILQAIHAKSTSKLVILVGNFYVLLQQFVCIDDDTFYFINLVFSFVN